MHKPRLIILGGLPGSGKTTVAHKLAKLLGAVHVRIDTIETPIMSEWPNGTDIADLGYRVAYGVTKDNLILGNDVVADSVNPIEVTRRAWREVGTAARASVFEVEIGCRDLVEHRSRVETRKADIDGSTLPTWQDVLDRQWDPWETAQVRIDTAMTSAAEAADRIVRLVDADYQNSLQH